MEEEEKQLLYSKAIQVYDHKTASTSMAHSESPDSQPAPFEGSRRRLHEYPIFIPSDLLSQVSPGFEAPELRDILQFFPTTPYWVFVSSAFSARYHQLYRPILIQITPTLQHPPGGAAASTTPAPSLHTLTTHVWTLPPHSRSCYDNRVLYRGR